MKTRHEPRRRPSFAVGILSLALLTACPSGHDDHAGHDHGPESNPDDGHEDHEEGHVELTESQFRSAGIEVTAAGPGDVTETLTLPGTVAPNADAVLHVTPRVSGQVRSVFKQLGESVVAGEPLCIIDSVQLGDAVADYLRDREMVRAAEETLARGRQLYQRRLDSLASVLDGAIVVQDRIHERERDLHEKAVSTVRPLLEAEKSLQLARLDKEKQLTELGAEREARLLTFEVDLRSKRIDENAARNRLRALGIGTEDLEGLTDESSLLAGEYRVDAPGSGVVVSRHVFTGEFVETGSKLYIIENLSNVWFVASAFEEQLKLVRTGQTAQVSLDAFSGTILNGTVSFLDYHVDPTSRSVGVRITLDNGQLDGWSEEFPLRPGMFGRVQLETASRRAAVALPERALVHEDAGDYVFVQVEPLAFERRDVTVKHVAGGMVEITSGLEVGEMVAVSGTFLLKSAERQSELGGGHSH